MSDGLWFVAGMGTALLLMFILGWLDHRMRRGK